MVNKLWLALQWYIPMLALHMFDVMLVSTHVLDVVLVRFLAIYGKVSSMQANKQASKKTDFTVDPIWWGLLRLAPISEHLYTRMQVSVVTIVMPVTYHAPLQPPRPR